METHPEGIAQKFSSPEEELVYLRKQIADREQNLANRGAEVKREEVVSDKLKDYSYVPVGQVLHPDFQESKSSIKELALNLAPEEHDGRMSELLKIVKEKGVKNALSVVEEMNDSHVEDDFHRFLVQYLKKGYEIYGLNSNRNFSGSYL